MTTHDCVDTEKLARKARDASTTNEAELLPELRTETQRIPSWKPYAALLAGWCALFASFGFTNTFGVYQTYYKEQHPDTANSVISLIGGLQIAVQYISGLFVGRAVDRFGPKPVVAFGALCCTLALMLLSFTNSIWQAFLTHGVLFGLGSSSLFMPAIAAGLTWFDAHKTLATAVALSGSGVGGIVLSIVFKQLQREIGWGWANRVLGFVLLCLTAPATILVEPRHKPDSTVSLIPDLSLLKHNTFAFLVLANFFGFFSAFGVFFFIEARATAVGMSPQLTQYLVPLYNGCIVILRIFPAVAADRFGPLNIFIVLNILGVLVQFCVWTPAHSSGGVIAVAVLWGLVAGAWSAVLPSCIPQVAGPERVASSMGVFYISSMPGALAGASIGGALMNGRPSGFQHAGLFWGCAQFASLVCGICSRLAVNRTVRAKE